jgi:uncharacterized SAM-dependent methyltransferase
MHLVSQCDQRVRIDREVFCFAEGEAIRTEYSHKYSLGDLGDLASASGFGIQRVWRDERNYFSVLYLTARGFTT